MTAKTACAVLIASLALAAPAAAQFGPPVIDNETPVVEELIVRSYGGPPWWKVSDKDTTVYILAGPGPLPPGVAFDRSQLDKRLTGANELIMPSELTMGLSALFALPGVNRLMNQMNGSKTVGMEAGLPPDVRARFVAGRQKIGQPETRYGALPVGLAGMALAGDARDARAKQTQTPRPQGLTFVGDVAVAAAKAKRVRVTPAKVYSGGAMNTFMREMKTPGLPCMVAALNEMENPPPDSGPSPAEQARAARAWAEGDVRPLIQLMRRNPAGATPSSTVNLVNPKKSIHLLLQPACLKAMPGVAKITDNWAAEEAAAIARALRKPGHAVAVLDAGTLLAQGGILDLLRRQGYTVKAPDVE